MLAALQALIGRIDGGGWPALDPRSMNARAAALDPVAPPAFTAYHPGPYPRPFDLVPARHA
jgi:hypothetical protein